LTKVDFGVSESLRSLKQQRKNIELGVSWTMKSNHLKQRDGYAHAWDVYAAVDGKALYAWPLMHQIHEAFLEASEITGILFEWGGLWKGKTADGPHYQLPKEYRGAA
jgi:hypothetical protein